MEALLGVDFQISTAIAQMISTKHDELFYFQAPRRVGDFLDGFGDGNSVEIGVPRDDGIKNLFAAMC